jgi:hypothetical protein
LTRTCDIYGASAEYTILYTTEVGAWAEYTILYTTEVGASAEYAILYTTEVGASAEYTILYTTEVGAAAEYTILYTTEVVYWSSSRQTSSFGMSSKITKFWSIVHMVNSLSHYKGSTVPMIVW